MYLWDLKPYINELIYKTKIKLMDTHKKNKFMANKGERGIN